jgi:hypothetical protein
MHLRAKAPCICVRKSDMPAWKARVSARKGLVPVTKDPCICPGRPIFIYFRQINVKMLLRVPRRPGFQPGNAMLADALFGVFQMPGRFLEAWMESKACPMTRKKKKSPDPRSLEAGHLAPRHPVLILPVPRGLVLQCLVPVGLAGKRIPALSGSGQSQSP